MSEKPVCEQKEIILKRSIGAFHRVQHMNTILRLLSYMFMRCACYLQKINFFIA